MGFITLKVTTMEGRICRFLVSSMEESQIQDTNRFQHGCLLTASMGSKVPRSCHYRILVGGFKDCLFSPLPGEDSQFDYFFSKGLKAPTRYILIGICFWKTDLCDFIDCGQSLVRFLTPLRSNKKPVFVSTLRNKQNALWLGNHVWFQPGKGELSCKTFFLIQQTS